MLTVFKPRVVAKAITHRPTPELAAFCITHSPGCRSTYSLSSSAAVGGFMPSIANCCGSASGGPEVTKRPPDTHKEILASFQCDGASARRPPRNQIGGMCCTENHVGLVKMYGNPSLWAFPTAITKLVRIRRAFRYFWPRE